MDNQLELLMRRIELLEQKLEICFQLLDVEDELDFILKGKYYTSDEIEEVLDGEY